MGRKLSFKEKHTDEFPDVVFLRREGNRKIVRIGRKIVSPFGGHRTIKTLKLK